jgi:hypothetical protein
VVEKSGNKWFLIPTMGRFLIPTYHGCVREEAIARDVVGKLLTVLKSCTMDMGQN